jgi:tRNA pseudouridine38-40 synthase
MRAALAHAVGTHDFGGFLRGTASGSTTRTLLRAEVHSASWARLHALVLEGTGFVRAMARNLVGTAVTAGVGILPPSRVAELLAARGRYRGVRAPAHGLTLAAVAYPQEH